MKTFKEFISEEYEFGESSTKFKIGDRVIVTDDVQIGRQSYGTIYIIKNEIGEIISSGHRDSNVSFDNNIKVKGAGTRKITTTHFKVLRVPNDKIQLYSDDEDTNYEEWVEESFNIEDFKVGDRVIITEVNENGLTFRKKMLGLKGTVVKINGKPWYDITINFDYIPIELKRVIKVEYEFDDNTLSISSRTKTYKVELLDELENTNYEEWTQE